jgi:hypothetical protein
MPLAPVAQWIEQPPSKRSVDGSIPSGRVLVSGSDDCDRRSYRATVTKALATLPLCRIEGVLWIELPISLNDCLDGNHLPIYSDFRNWLAPCCYCVS